ncbi:uncharacterized protein Dvar_24330 [Desulfosarcina variabilis str. Montpellier]|uniref:DUF4136 domain-containing protein n=1 Tax=Desulfosarcina variabilis TaxID=2300 RepID=UPI003AFB734B
MMKYRWCIIALAIFLWVGCSGIQTSQDYDPKTDFQSIQTVAWATPTQPKTGDERIDNPFRDTRIRAAIRQQLEKKGLRFKPDQTPDVLVRYQYTIRQRIDSAGSGGSVGFGIGSYGSRGGIAIGTSTGNNLREIDEGTLVIDLVGAESDTLLWRGSGIQRFEAYDNPKKTTQVIDTLVESILNQFPPSN